MKILIISQYFWPEGFLINDFALSLRDRNHEVEILTGLPNYPSGRFFKGYSFKGPYYEDYHGIPVWRSPLVPRGKANGWRLALNYLSFAVFSCVWGMLFCRKKFDVILVFEVSPVTVGIPARMMKALTRAKLFFWVQDLWPESLSATGAVHSKPIISCVGEMTRWIYKGCDLILMQSKAFRSSILNYGADNNRIRYFPNYVDDHFQVVTLTEDAPEHDLMPDGFRVMFAGNIGEAQDFETILKAAELTMPNPEIQWLIVGDGRRRHWVERQIRERGLIHVHLLGYHPAERMPTFFSLADVMLVSLKDDPIFSMTIPSKIQAYLACGKPVLASLGGEGTRIIEEAKAGLTVPAESPEKLADSVLKMATMSPEHLKTMGGNARTYYEKYFSRTSLLDEFERWMCE